MRKLMEKPCGSSPRMWGTPKQRRHDLFGHRFIPTHVGNTPARRSRLEALPVHPHACGEHVMPMALAISSGGSSPRMWGTRKHRRVGEPGLPVHPHACGEHPAPSSSPPPASGSSPRMWGTPRPGRHRTATCRFIPTHVGNTSRRYSRGRGSAGSSPRMWGTRLVSVGGVRYRRFIPTHVGNTAETCTSEGVYPVHPHACGEHAGRFHGPEGNGGSSPRMWGTRVSRLQALYDTRFIPTHVGNTTEQPGIWNGTPVHPHACGEHGIGYGGCLFRVGSSPRMWGTLGADAAPSTPRRFIPTHVGNTQ